MTFSFPIRRIAMVLAVAGAGVDAQASGNFDPTFASGGTARIGGLETYGPTSIAVRAGGHIVYAASRPSFGDVLVGARNADGSEDDGFAFGGLIPIAVSGGSVSQPVLAFDPASGATVLAATALQNGLYHLLLCRILDDGTLDPTFHLLNYPDQTGCIVTNVPAGVSNGLNVSGIQVTASGVLLLGGTVFDFAHPPGLKAFFSVVQSGFVDVATQILTVAANNVTISGIATDNDSPYTYLSGTIQLDDGSGGVDEAMLVIKTSDVNGWTYQILNPNLVPHGSDEGRAIAVRPGSKIVVVGALDDASPQFNDCAIYQLNDDLTPDAGFGDGGNGFFITNFTGGIADGATCDTATVDGDKLFVGGMLKRDSDSDRDMVVARFTPNGFDAAFGNIGAGISSIDPGDSASTTVYERVLAMGVQNGRVILAGPSEPTSGATPANSDMIIVRLAEDDFIFATSNE